jgi:hypothetical protein
MSRAGRVLICVKKQPGSLAPERNGTESNGLSLLPRRAKTRGNLDLGQYGLARRFYIDVVTALNTKECAEW